MTVVDSFEAYREWARVHAADLYHAVTSLRASAADEMEFQRGSDKIFAELGADLDIQVYFEEQCTLVTGRADSIYNRFVIEYERPGSMRLDLGHAHTGHAVQQCIDYMDGLVHRDHYDPSRLLAAAFDGHVCIFVRRKDDEWQIDSPIDWSEACAEELLYAFASLAAGRALTPENIVADFGSGTVLCQRATRAFYDALTAAQSPLVSALYSQWRTYFSEVTEFNENEQSADSDLVALARRMHIQTKNLDHARLLFGLQTYFSVLAKLIATLVLERYTARAGFELSLSAWARKNDEELLRDLALMEEGKWSEVVGVKNLFEADFFSWYLHDANSELLGAIREILGRLSNYDPSTVSLAPDLVRDLLKKLYHYLLPRDIRHALGEYYTPDWLASHVLKSLDDPLFSGEGTPETTDFEKRLLDPTCGSGTFIVLAIRAFRNKCAEHGVSGPDTLRLILKNIVGFDLNPLAVLASKVNYLLGIADLLSGDLPAIELPVYLCDSILMPQQGGTLFTHAARVLRTVVGDFPVPLLLDSKDEIERLSDLLYDQVHAKTSVENFLALAAQSGLVKDAESSATLRALYSRLLQLENEGRDGVWARLLKNSFMPLFIGRFDYVVGNPPWINWQHLPENYRQDTVQSWDYYELFNLTGFEAILGKAKDDISILATYVSVDHYLKNGGQIAFVITQTLFKSSGGGAGFRRFQLPSGEQFGPLAVDDLSSLAPFEGATNRTSVFRARKGTQVTYPVPYTYWKKVPRERLDYESSLKRAYATTVRAELAATPINQHEPTSSWISVHPEVADIVPRILGTSHYQGREGTNTGGANAIFWLDVLGPTERGTIRARNLTEGARNAVDSITVELEPDLVYPLLRGRDVKAWKAVPSAHILVPHTKSGGLNAIPEAEMAAKYPLTYSYLKRFENRLTGRSIMRRYFSARRRNGRPPFYSMFNVGTYTFEPYKAIWPEFSTDFCAATLGNASGETITIPDHKLMFVPCRSDDEARYLSAILNSVPMRYIAKAYTIGTQIGTHIVDNISIPTFDPSDRNHVQILEASSQEDMTAQEHLCRAIWGVDADGLSRLAQALERW